MRQIILSFFFGYVSHLIEFTSEANETILKSQKRLDPADSRL